MSPLWDGPSKGDSPHGPGILSTIHESLGRITLFDGIMDMGRFVSGTLYKISGTKVYKSFEGDFNGEGTSFDVDGLVIFMGPFLNGKPHGFGWGSVRMGDMLCDFSGTYEHVYKSGTLYFDDCRYIGALHPVSGLPCGRGLYIDGGIHLDGIARLDGSRLSFKGRGPFPDYTDDTFPKLRFVNGTFDLTSLYASLHGLCAIVFHSGSDLLKVVGLFEYDTIASEFDVYKIDDTDAVFTSDVLTTGQKWAHLSTDGFHYKIQRYDASGALEYDGTGVFLFKETWNAIWAEGLGTLFEAGHPSVTGEFDRDDLTVMHVLFDASGNLLWKLSQKGQGLSGKLDGTGSVFSEDGRVLYTLTFDDGVLLDNDSFWKALPRVPYPIAGEDPITKEPFRKGRLGIRLNGTVYSLQTIKDYWAQAGFGTDPVYGTLVLRLELLKFT